MNRPLVLLLGLFLFVQSISALTAPHKCDSLSSICLSVSVDGPALQAAGNVTFRLEAPARVGWVGMGVGQTMPNSYIVVAWLGSETNNTVIVSQRRASTYAEPRPWGNQSDIHVDAARSGIWDDRFVVVFTRPKVLTGSVVNETVTDYFWATADLRPIGQMHDASITHHTLKGMFGGMDMTNALGGDLSAVIGGGDYTDYQKLVFAHAVCMTAAWGVFAPIAAFLARFAKTSRLPWFHLHWSIQVFGVTLVTIGGCVLGYLASGQNQLQLPHQWVGVSIAGVLLLQLFLGWFHHHRFDPTRDYKPWWTQLHWWVGRILIIAGLINIPLGLAVHDSGIKYSIAYYVYLGLLVFTFVLFTIRSTVFGDSRAAVGNAGKLRKGTYIKAENDDMFMTEVEEQETSVMREREELDVRVIKE